VVFSFSFTLDYYFQASDFTVDSGASRTHSLALESGTELLMGDCHFTSVAIQLDGESTDDRRRWMTSDQSQTNENPAIC
jgi:hypothetical protein